MVAEEGGLLLDIHAESFAERSEQTRRFVWDLIPKNAVIRGALDFQTLHPVIKIVTRAANMQEMERFQHPKIPLIGEPLFGPIPIEAMGEPLLGELF